MDDGESLVEAAHESVLTVGAWLGWCQEGFSLADAESWFTVCDQNMEMGTAYDYGIFSRENNLLMGGIGINHVNREHNFANMGYWIRQSEQGRGIAYEAVKAITLFGFETLKLTRLEIVVAEGNIASRRVAEKSGAVFECIARNRLMVQGKPQSAAFYSLVPE